MSNKKIEPIIEEIDNKDLSAYLLKEELKEARITSYLGFSAMMLSLIALSLFTTNVFALIVVVVCAFIVFAGAIKKKDLSF